MSLASLQGLSKSPALLKFKKKKKKEKNEGGGGIECQAGTTVASTPLASSAAAQKLGHLCIVYIDMFPFECLSQFSLCKYLHMNHVSSSKLLNESGLSGAKQQSGAGVADKQPFTVGHTSTQSVIE